MIDIWQHLEIIFQQHLATILKISVRFTLKWLRCKLSSSFDIISEEGGILVLQLAVIFKMNKKNESKRKHP